MLVGGSAAVPQLYSVCMALYPLVPPFGTFGLNWEMFGSVRVFWDITHLVTGW